MKYKIIFIYMLLCYTYNAAGQDFLYYRHDVSVSLGVLSSPAQIHGRGPAPVAFSAQYAYQLSKQIGFCLIANCSPIKDSGWYEERFIDEEGKPHYKDVQAHETVGEYLSIMPALRLNWVNKHSFTLYTKAAFGISYDTDEDKAYSAVQLSPLGITLGKRLCGTVELGIGKQGVFVFGLGYRFK